MNTVVLVNAFNLYLYTILLKTMVQWDSIMGCNDPTGSNKASNVGMVESMGHNQI
jgi:hypothetical protein